MKKKFLIFVGGLAILIADFFPQLFLGKSVGGDSVLYFFPALSFFKQQILAHHSFLWTRGILGGFPISLDLNGGYFSPINLLLFKYFSVGVAYNLALIIGIGLLFLFTYLFVRRLGISVTGSLLVAVAFSFGQQINIWSINLTVVNALFVLPLLLFCISKIASGRYAWILLGGLGVGYALLTGQPQWILMAFIGAGFYILYLLWPSIKTFSFSKYSLSPLKPLLGLVVMATIGVAIAWFQLYPSNQLGELSARAGGLSFQAAQLSSQTPIDWLWYLFPNLEFKYLSAQEPTLYVGILPLIFAIFAVAALFKREKVIRFFSYFFLFGLLTALTYSPIFWLIHQLPVFNLFRGSNRWMYLGNFGLAVLAGFGFDAFREAGIPAHITDRVQKILLWIFSIATGIAIFFNAVFLIFSSKLIKFLDNYFDKHYYAHTTKLPIEHYHNVIASTVNATFYNLSFLNYKFTVPLTFIFVGYLLLHLLNSKNKLVWKYLTLIVITISVLNLITLDYNYHQSLTLANVESQSPVADFLRQQEGTNIHQVRVLTVLPGTGVDQKLDTPFYQSSTDNDDFEFERDLLFVDTNMTSGVDSIDGYDNLMPRRNSRILGILSSQTATIGQTLSTEKISIDDKLKEIESRLPLLSMLNVKYVVSAYAFPANPSFPLVDTVYSTRFKIPIYLYENTKVLPRVYLANTPVFIGSDELKNFDVIIDPKNDFSKNTFIECQTCGNFQNVPSPKDTVTVSDYEDGLLDLKVSTQSGRWLVFSESNLPGWKATIDGQPTTIYTSNYIFQTIYVPKGAHVVKWEYVGI